MLDEFIATWPAALRAHAPGILALVGGAAAGALVAQVLFAALRRVSRREGQAFAASVYANVRRPLKLVIVLLGVLVACNAVDNAAGDGLVDAVARLAEVGLYGAGAWLVVECVEVVGDLLLGRYSYAGRTDNLRERKLYTQLLYVKRVVTGVAVVVAIALTLFQFERVRELGTGLLASAGIAGIVVGLAAQKSLANLLAGFQIAFTQPIRIDDQVLVRGEVGRVEEITLTYVVVRVWDDRRLVVPLGKFIDEPFENWSRRTTEITGVVLLYLDYGADLTGVRAELARLVAGHPAYDGRAAKLQVTDASEVSMTVRVLVTARTPGEAFELRCAVREGLLEYVRREQPAALPRRRWG